MDRDKRWDRLELAYKALVSADANTSFATPSDAISAAYNEK